MKPFIDIASYQQGARGIDWVAVTKYLTGIDPEAGVIIKVLERLSATEWYVNPYLHQQRMGAHAAGLRNVGLFVFARPSLGPGHEEAEKLLEVIGADGGILKGEFLCRDDEDKNVAPNADLDAATLDFHDTISGSLGILGVEYTGRWYADPHNLNRDPRLAALGLWWAAVQDAIPTVPEPWRSAGKQILLWQHDWHGAVPGIEGDVDLDYLVGGIGTLRPYQWGFAPNPLAGQPVDPPPDVAVPANSESVTDAGTVAKKISEDALALANLLSDAELKRRAMVIKSDADLIVKITWNH